MSTDEVTASIDVHLLETSLRGLESFYTSSLRDTELKLRTTEYGLVKSDLEATLWKSRYGFLEESSLALCRRYQLELANRSDEIALLAQQVMKKTPSRDASPSSSQGVSVLVQTRETQLERLAVQMDSLNGMLQLQTGTVESAEKQLREAELTVASLDKELKESRALADRLGRQLAVHEKSGAFQRFLSAAAVPAQVPSFLRQRGGAQIDQTALIQFLSELRAEVAVVHDWIREQHNA